jgi:HD-GYP domain-containing protein (c-di-GMP phosphodiesterase class II)
MENDENSREEHPQHEPESEQVAKLGVFAFLDESKKKSAAAAENQAAPANAPKERSSAAGDNDSAGQRSSILNRGPVMEHKLTILVLEDYPEVMDTIVGNITRYLHPRRQLGEVVEASAGQHYSIQGVTDIAIVQAATPEDAFNVFGYFDGKSRAFNKLHACDENQIFYGVFDVVLGHSLSGIDVLEIIKQHVPEFRAIVLTAQTNTEEEIARTVELADAYRKKQVSMDPEHRYLLAQDIAEKVTDIVEDRRTREQAIRSKALLSTMPELLAVVLDYYDFITGTHCRGVTDLALYIGDQLKSLPRYAGRLEYGDQQLDLEMLGFNAVLHDIGKIMAPKRILGKTGMFSKEEQDFVEVVCKEISRVMEDWDDVPEHIRLGIQERLNKFRIDEERQEEIKMLGRLTPNELEVVRFHVAASELIRDDLRPFVEDTLVDPDLVAYIMRLFDGLYHHERPDGSGYPYGYSGESYDRLPTAAKIILVADTYHALRSKRSYKDGMTHAVAVNILRELADANRVVSDCVDIISGLPTEIIESVDARNEQRIARLIRRAHQRVNSLGVRNPAQLFVDLMSSNAINPDDYLDEAALSEQERNEV